MITWFIWGNGYAPMSETTSPCSPSSSRTSRRTPSSGDSSFSRNPVTSPYHFSGHSLLRTSRTVSPCSTSAATTGVGLSYGTYSQPSAPQARRTRPSTFFGRSGAAQDGQNFISGIAGNPSVAKGHSQCQIRTVPPRLFTFDVFGTIVDWRSGLRKALASRLLPDTQFDRLIDVQGEIEQGPFRRYAEILAESLVRVLGISPSDAERIGADAGKWPLFPDSAAALARLRRIAPCAATTNSDRAHGEDVQRALGFRLD